MLTEKYRVSGSVGHGPHTFRGAPFGSVFLMTWLLHHSHRSIIAEFFLPPREHLWTLRVNYT